MWSILGGLRVQFGWNSIVIVASPDNTNGETAAELACELSGKLSCEANSAVRDSAFGRVKTESMSVGGLNEQLSSAREIMRGVKTSKDRIIFFLGPEVPFRYLICASHSESVHPGLTWLSEGVKASSWWTQPDEALEEKASECTPDLIMSLFVGSINIVGLGAPLDAEMDTKLDCFADSVDHKYKTSASLNAEIRQKLAEGYPTANDPNGTAVQHPHEELINLAVDGVCAIALTVKRMLDRGIAIENLRTPAEKEFRSFVRHMRSVLDFQGASGRVQITGNDLNKYLGAWQVSGNTSRLVGYILSEHIDDERIPEKDRLITTVNLSWATGLDNSSWEAAPEDVVIDDSKSFPILAVVIPALVLFFGTICCYAIYSSRKAGGKNEKSDA